MRTLLVLIKRQIVDNAIYFAIALLVCIVLIIAVTVLALTEERTHLSLYALVLIVAVPIFFCAGSYTLGLRQVHDDRSSGIAAVLAVLPATRSRILLARLVVGLLVILTVSGPLAILGAVLWKLMGPPAWLFHGWLAHTFVGMDLTAFTCYCLGLHAGGTSGTFTAGLRALPLTVILLLLIIIKGFGFPLLVILVPFVVLALIRCWESLACRFLRNVTSGLMVLILLTVPLHFGRRWCDGLLACRIDAEAKISPSGLLPPEIENDPNVEDHSIASSSFRRLYSGLSIVPHLLGSHFYDFSEYFDAGPYLLEDSGIIQYFESQERGDRYSYYSRGFWEPPIELIHLDGVAGQLVCHRKSIDSYTDEQTWKLKDATEIYFGPKGISEARDNKLGRFGSPVIYYYFKPRDYLRDSPPQCVVYDANSRCFFAIDLKNQTLRKGPRLVDSSVHPVKNGTSVNLLGVRYRLPSNRYGLRVRVGALTSSGYLPFVDELGQIHLLDPNTLEVRGPAGSLPHPKTFAGWSPARPRDLLDFGVSLVAIEAYAQRPTYEEIKGEYLGLVAGSVSRQGMWTSVAVFDKDGNMVKTAYSKADFFEQPWGPVITAMKYLFESLHPPVLTLASYFTAYSFEARSTYRALFLIPNSFVAMAKDYEGNAFYEGLIVLLLMLPAILLAGLLAWRVDRDAARIGLSLNTRRCWLLGTLAFGLVGYITYRLTRPKMTLVTCANCGHPRRPDMDKCHRCGGPWHIPELIPPAWRVVDGEVKGRTSVQQEIKAQETRGSGNQEKPTQL